MNMLGGKAASTCCFLLLALYSADTQQPNFNSRGERKPTLDVCKVEGYLVAGLLDKLENWEKRLNSVDGSMGQIPSPGFSGVPPTRITSMDDDGDDKMQSFCENQETLINEVSQRQEMLIGQFETMSIGIDQMLNALPRLEKRLRDIEAQIKNISVETTNKHLEQQQRPANNDQISGNSVNNPVVSCNDFKEKLARNNVLRRRLPIGNYYFNKTEMNWYEAKYFCQQLEMQLATIDSTDEANFVSKTIGYEYKHFWLSASDSVQSPGRYVWAEGSMVQHVLWAHGFPQRHHAAQGLHCVTLSTGTAKLDEQNCRHDKNFVLCEMEPQFNRCL